MTYVKLFSEILDSTVWTLSNATKIVWIALLAMKDRDGVVEASVPGLAKRAGVTREECEAALKCFLAPDPDSRTKDHGGRRIEAVDGGWRVLNSDKYRKKLSADDRREQNAARQARWRANRKDRAPDPESDPDQKAEQEAESDTGSVTERDRALRTPPPPLSADPDPDHRRAGKEWRSEDWLRLFGRAWSAKYDKAYADASDRKACGTLDQLLAALPVGDVLEAQARADRMVRSFLASHKPATVKVRHPFAWFVTEFGGLRVDEIGEREPQKYG